MFVSVKTYFTVDSSAVRQEVDRMRGLSLLMECYKDLPSPVTSEVLNLRVRYHPVYPFQPGVLGAHCFNRGVD